MSLATRCFACGTVFRVVQDQLKVSEGWVRCGRCNEVFNALESLFDLERDAPPEWTPSTMIDLEAMEPVRAADPPSHAHANAPDAATARADHHADEHLPGSRRREAATTPAARVDERDRLEFPDARFESDFDTPEAATALHDTTLEPGDSAPEPPGGAAFEFIRRAQRRERWNRPAVRAALAGLAIALGVLLVAQIVHHARDTIAARWPDSKPALNAWCAAFGCSVQPPMRVDDLLVENSALTRAAGTDGFRLSMLLRNRGTLAVALPHIDLSLTDAGGQLIARRMLAPAAWGAKASAIAAGADLPIQLRLTAGDQRVSGYTVEIFYP